MNDRNLLGGPGGHHHHSMGPGAAAIHAMGQIDTNMVAQQPSTPTGDLLGFDAQQQQQPQQQVINANHATVSITTSGTGGTTAAPAIAGIGKIESSGAQNGNNSGKPKKKLIYVPTYSCNGGLDTKVSAHFIKCFS